MIQKILENNILRNCYLILQEPREFVLEINRNLTLKYNLYTLFVLSSICASIGIMLSYGREPLYIFFPIFVFITIFYWFTSSLLSNKLDHILRKYVSVKLPEKEAVPSSHNESNAEATEGAMSSDMRQEALFHLFLAATIPQALHILANILSDYGHVFSTVLSISIVLWSLFILLDGARQLYSLHQIHVFFALMRSLTSILVFPFLLIIYIVL